VGGLRDAAGGRRSRQDEAERKGRGHVCLRGGRDGYSGVHHRDRGGGGRTKRRRHGDRERGAVRPVPAPPAPGPGGSGYAPVLLRSDLRQPERGDPGPAAGDDPDRGRI